MRHERVSTDNVDSNPFPPLLVAALVAVAAVGAAGAVPDARVTVDAVTVTPGEPVVGERTALNVTVANSGGSPAAGEVTAVRLLDADDTTLDEASTPGALSPGDTLETKLWTSFETPGEHRLTVEVVADEAVGDGEDANPNDPPTVTVTRDVVVDVAPAEPSIALRARPLAPEDLQTDEDDGGVNVGGGDSDGRPRRRDRGEHGHRPRGASERDRVGGSGRRDRSTRCRRERDDR